MSVDAATAALVHEIKQPLTGIRMQASAARRWLAQTPPDVEKVRERIEEILEASQRTEEVISSVRGLIRRASDERTALHINDVARQVLALMEHDLQVNQVAITTRYGDDLPQVMGNRTLLQQVVLNIVRNAIEAMSSVDRRRRHLRLATWRDENSAVLLSVEDSGQGIPAADRHRIFDPFFTTKPTGTGLGLSICRTTIEDHGGSLRLTKTDSHGSVFEMALPGRSVSPADQ